MLPLFECSEMLMCFRVFYVSVCIFSTEGGKLELIKKFAKDGIFCMQSPEFFSGLFFVYEIDKF